MLSKHFEFKVLKSKTFNKHTYNTICAVSHLHRIFICNSSSFIKFLFDFFVFKITASLISFPKKLPTTFKVKKISSSYPQSELI